LQLLFFYRCRNEADADNVPGVDRRDRERKIGNLFVVEVRLVPQAGPEHSVHRVSA
jgi:hypothetical protein